MTELNKLNNFQTKVSHENIIRQYFKIWISKQNTNFLKKMNYHEIHKMAFVDETCFGNNHGLQKNHFYKISKTKNGLDSKNQIINQFGINFMKNYVGLWEETHKLPKNLRIDLTNNFELINCYCAILGMKIVIEWWNINIKIHYLNSQ